MEDVVRIDLLSKRTPVNTVDGHIELAALKPSEVASLHVAVHPSVEVLVPREPRTSQSRPKGVRLLHREPEQASAKLIKFPQNWHDHSAVLSGTQEPKKSVSGNEEKCEWRQYFIPMQVIVGFCLRTEKPSFWQVSGGDWKAWRRKSRRPGGEERGRGLAQEGGGGEGRGGGDGGNSGG